jgi:integrase
MVSTPAPSERRYRPGTDYVDTWEGGFIRRNARGQKVYVIRRMVNGALFKVSTRCHTETAAVAQLRRFEANPSAYRPDGDTGERLKVDDDLIDAFLDYSRDVKRNTEQWVGTQRRYLEWWRDVLDGRDLRQLKTPDLVRLLQDARGKPVVADKMKREVIKALASWLRTERHLLTKAADPTLDLKIPQGNSKTRDREDKSFPVGHYLKARKHLTGRYRWALDVLAGTGIHAASLPRFVKDGRFEPYRGTDKKAAAGVIVFPEEKDREEHRVAVSKEVLAAAKRLRSEGYLHLGRFAKALERACIRAKVEPHTPGRYRHAVATWAVNRGADLGAVASFLGHRSPATTRKFYATHATAAKVPTAV